jgi:hypothetical protein
MAGSAIGNATAGQVLHTSYIQIPLLLKGLSDLGFGQVGLFVGPEIFIKAGNFYRTDQNGKTAVSLDQALFNSVFLGLVLGVDLNIELGPGRLFIDTRFNWGINSVYNQHLRAANDFKQDIVQVFLGYGFRLLSREDL